MARARRRYAQGTINDVYALEVAYLSREADGLGHDALEEWVALAHAAHQRLRAHDQRLHRKICSTQDLSDQIERPARITDDDEEVDVAAPVLLAPGERAEKVDGLGAEIGDELSRQDHQFAKKGFTRSRIERADCRHMSASPFS